MKISGTKEELIDFRNGLKIEKIMEFKYYLDRKLQREVHPMKNIVYDCIAKFNKTFAEEIEFNKSRSE